MTQRNHTEAFTLNKKRRDEEDICVQDVQVTDNGTHMLKCIFSSIICITGYIIKPGEMSLFP